MLTNLALKYK